jgi:hypothetical protein
MPMMGAVASCCSLTSFAGLGRVSNRKIISLVALESRVRFLAAQGGESCMFMTEKPNVKTRYCARLQSRST